MYKPRNIKENIQYNKMLMLKALIDFSS